VATEIDLTEARRRVARAIGAETTEPWTAGDVRWISGHWGIFRPELELCERLGDEIVEIERAVRPWWFRLGVDLAGGLGWWYRDAPASARLGLAAVGLFLIAFAWGWL
jgi:hypothetical protein